MGDTNVRGEEIAVENNGKTSNKKRENKVEEKNVERINKSNEEIVVGNNGKVRKKRSKNTVEDEKLGKTNESNGEIAVENNGKKSKKKRNNTEEEEKIERTNECNEENEVENIGKKSKKKRKKTIDEENLENEGNDEIAAENHGKKRRRKNTVEEEKKLGRTNEGNEEVAMENKEKKGKKKKKNTVAEETIGRTKDGDEEVAVENNGKKSNKKKKNTVEGEKLGKTNEHDEEIAVKSNGKKGKRKKKNPVVGENCGHTNEDNEEIALENNGEKTDSMNIENTKKSENLNKKKKKKVQFSGNVEIFPSSPSLDHDDNNHPSKDGLVHAKRFTPEEDEKLKEAVFKYIEEHELGEDGIDMVLNCGSHRETKGCWKEISLAIPYRPVSAMYHRGHTLFKRSEERKWTPEEYELIRKYHKEHGADWTTLAKKLGKHRIHVKDTWRRIKLTNQKKGKWAQQEYQSLFDLVNLDLQLKIFEEKKVKHGMLRDNIAWGAISDKLETRMSSNCCVKWYNQLTSPMVVEGIWADTDDFRLLDALFKEDASCMEDVDWDNLIGHRSGEICRKRWLQMVKHIGEHRNKAFIEQVEILVERYRPDLLEAKEEYANRTPVDL